MPLTTTVLADRPELAPAMWAMETSWPEFMRHDSLGGLYYAHAEERFAEFVVVGEDDGEVVATAHSIPFVAGEGPLPDHGWGAAIRNGFLTDVRGARPDAVSAVEISVRPDRQGTGLSGLMLTAMRENAARLGFADLLAPVRPSGKTDPHEPMASYASRTRDDGLPVDPWLRVHVRAGGVVEKVAPRSMCIPGTLAEWREWTGLPFDATGPVVVPRALAPVWADVEHGVATYVEPNVWVRHATGAPRTGATTR